ncbi:hypothetical protein NKH77_52515 [Streptomyces sp. M19]
MANPVCTRVSTDQQSTARQNPVLDEAGIEDPVVFEEDPGTSSRLHPFSGRSSANCSPTRGRATPCTSPRRSASYVAPGTSSACSHRDLKPANLMLTNGGEVKVLDFGIARFMAATDKASQVMGTLAYMARRQEVDLPHGLQHPQTPVVSGGLVYAIGHDELYAIHAAQGTKTWSVPSHGRELRLAGDTLYVGGATGELGLVNAFALLTGPVDGGQK